MVAAHARGFDTPLQKLLAFDSMPEVYGSLLRLLCHDSRAGVETNARTGARVKVLPGGVSFRLDLSLGLPTVGLRRTFPRVAAAETAWYVMGTTDVRWLRRHRIAIWDKFTEGDGFTVASAYGYRWRHHFGRDQLQLALETLARDPSDRRCYVSAWDPSSDGVGALEQPNVPCPVGFNLSVLNGELHSTLTWRSCDVFVGLPYDVMGHALLMAACAATLGVRPGTLSCSIGHAHLYETHWEMAREAISQPVCAPSLPLPTWTVGQVGLSPDAYINEVAQAAAGCAWPAFSPKPEVVQ